MHSYLHCSNGTIYLPLSTWVRSLWLLQDKCPAVKVNFENRRKKRAAPFCTYSIKRCSNQRQGAEGAPWGKRVLLAVS